MALLQLLCRLARVTYPMRRAELLAVGLALGITFEALPLTGGSLAVAFPDMVYVSDDADLDVEPWLRAHVLAHALLHTARTGIYVCRGPFSATEEQHEVEANLLASALVTDPRADAPIGLWRPGVAALSPGQAGA